MARRATVISLEDRQMVIAGEPTLNTDEGVLIIGFEDGTFRTFNWDYVVDFYHMTEEEYLHTDLHGQLDTARRSFGDASVKDGPGRPNRPKLTEREVMDIRQAYRGGMKQRDLAANYGVNSATISRLVRGIYH